MAFEAKSNVRTLIPHPPLLITGVYDALIKIAGAKGTGAAKTKQAVVEKLLVAAKGEETRFLVRTLCQNLRVGAVRTSLAALARATVLSPPPAVSAALTSDSPFHISPQTLAAIKPLVGKKKASDDARDALNATFAQAEGAIKRVYVQHPNYDHIVRALLEGGLEGLANRLPLTIGECRPSGPWTRYIASYQYSFAQVSHYSLRWGLPRGPWMRSTIGSGCCLSQQSSSTTVSAPRSTHQGAWAPNTR